MSSRYFTIGHSNQPIEAFIEALHANGITLVIDVRKLPGSRANPQFNADSLEESLGREDIAFRRIPELAGRRGRDHSVASEVNGIWRNQSFHNYADYALHEEFRRGLDDLVAAGAQQSTAVMCAEAVWWRCHRRIIADHLLAGGRNVQHVMPGGACTPATLTPGAETATDARVTYPAE